MGYDHCRHLGIIIFRLPQRMKQAEFFFSGNKNCFSQTISNKTSLIRLKDPQIRKIKEEKIKKEVKINK